MTTTVRRRNAPPRPQTPPARRASSCSRCPGLQSGGVLGLFLAALALAACHKDPVKELSAETLRLGEYCRGLKVGDATPEIPAWIAQQGSKPDATTVQLTLGGKGVSTCHVTIDTTTNKVTAVRYQPD